MVYFMCGKLRFIFYLQLHDLQFHVPELFHFGIDTIILTQLDTPSLSQISSLSIYFPFGPDWKK